MAIFNSYVSLQEGVDYPPFHLFLTQEATFEKGKHWIDGRFMWTYGDKSAGKSMDLFSQIVGTELGFMAIKPVVKINDPIILRKSSPINFHKSSYFPFLEKIVHNFFSWGFYLYTLIQATQWAPSGSILG
jgi:hypothetical protein